MVVPGQLQVVMAVMVEVVAVVACELKKLTRVTV